MTYLDGICVPDNPGDLLMIHATLRTICTGIGSVDYRVGEHIEGQWFRLLGMPEDASPMDLVGGGIEGRCALWIGGVSDAPQAMVFFELPDPQRAGAMDTGRLGDQIPAYNYTHA